METHCLGIMCSLISFLLSTPGKRSSAQYLLYVNHQEEVLHCGLGVLKGIKELGPPYGDKNPFSLPGSNPSLEDVFTSPEGLATVNHRLGLGGDPVEVDG